MQDTLGHITGVFNRGADHAPQSGIVLSIYSANRTALQIALYAVFMRFVST